MSKKINRYFDNLIQESNGSGCMVHFYIADSLQHNNSSNPFGSTNFFEFNFLSKSPEWIMKGSTGHGLHFKKRPTTIPVLNFFRVDDKFKKAFIEMTKNERHRLKFKNFVAFSIRGFRIWLGKEDVFDVKTNPIPAKSEEEAIRRDNPYYKNALQPFNYCDIVRVRIPKNDEVSGRYLQIPSKYIRAIGSSSLLEPSLTALCEKKKIYKASIISF